jgi:Asp/Glu/hydantoin racemase
MRFLLYNPNSDKALSDDLGRTIAPFLRPGDSVDLGTAESGPPFIGSDETIENARQSLLNQLPSRAARADATILACFGNIDIDLVRRAVDQPIVSLWDATLAMAPLLGKRLGIVTTTAYWVDRLAADIHRQGQSHRIGTIRAVSPSPMMSRDRLIALCQTSIANLVADAKVDVVVLGGALFVGLREDLAKSSPLPILDPLAAATGLCRTLVEATDRANASSTTSPKERWNDKNQPIQRIHAGSGDFSG